ncbi:MAG: class I tRNA ligase family protein [Candidatus Peribacteria bacterium]|nr:class I tRNA ligase family protein [Candidatus Peribacteria bacterium]
MNKEFGQIEKRFQQTDTPILNSFSPVKGKDETTNGTSYKYFYTKYNQEIDLHKHFVDEILVKHPKTGTTLKRVPEVLDCWFESGSMPYASKHYPFSENFQYSSSENLLKKSSDILSFKPADFIAE